MKCPHLKSGKMVNDWVDGITVEADHRMVAVKFEVDVYSSNGWKIPDRILWCAHGSANIRRITDIKKGERDE